MKLLPLIVQLILKQPAVSGGVTLLMLSALLGKPDRNAP